MSFVRLPTVLYIQGLLPQPTEQSYTPCNYSEHVYTICMTQNLQQSFRQGFQRFTEVHRKYGEVS